MGLACNLALELHDHSMPGMLQMLTCFHQHIIVKQFHLPCQSHAVVYIMLLITYDGCLYIRWKP